MNKEKFNRSIDDIEVPVEKLLARENIAMLQGKKRRKVRESVQSSLLAVSGLCLIILASGFFSTGMAAALSNLPIIGGALEEFVYSKEYSLKDYKTVIGESVEDNGMSVTLNEVVLDEGQLLISSTFHTELSDEDLEYNWFSDIEVYLNGSEITTLGGGGGPQEITDSYVNYFWTNDLPNVKMEDNQQIKIVFHNLERFDSKKVIEGKWSFSFTASGEKLMEDREIVSIDKQFMIEDDQLVNVEDLVLTPVSTRLSYSMENVTNDVNFKLEDQNGVELQEFSARSMGGKNYNRFLALDSHVTKLKVIPYIIDRAKGHEKILDDEIFEIEAK
ncbi:DUF4179 domain-containing protein [Alkalihalobacillus trypoxylicola]|uniref:DUF4179 domain-containing protein n=1 Tax=Alkalihalobacillus trypoxylicola TaxID=519424 RepID=A0A161PBB8_9BACI|nr:DUF4179 domain-containing protein [Alkalihalobacillus trypoxylicola]KYG29522.1 hypothetical protein AZF04_08355 [Alkalihalobacillus trypoxylicola]